MDHVQIPIEVNNQDWKQRCNERMEKLKQFPSQDASSRQGLVQKELYGEKKNMNFELYEAVDNGDVDRFVDVLEQVSASKGLHLSAIFDQVTQAGDSLLHVAADLGREQIAELIACHFPWLLTRRNIRGNTVLHVAAKCKNCDVIKVILTQYAIEKSKYGTDLQEITRITNEYGDTALHEAMYGRHLSGITNLLFADSPVVHYLNKSGRSPLYLAVMNGDVEILGLLLQIPFPANEPLPQCHGNSPLHAAILERNPVVLREILVRKPELIYSRDEDGGTPLHLAASIGYVEGVCILLKTSTLTALERNKKGHLPIHLACKKGHVEVVGELLQQEWPNPRVLLNQKGQNILHVAAKAGENNVVKYLLRNKKIDHATINEKDVNGNTPLHLAARNLFIENLYSLTRDKRIDVRLINNEGLTASDIVLLLGESPSNFRKYLSIATLDSAGVPCSEKVDSMFCRSIREPNTDWVKDKFNTLMVVSILMTTLTFAAAFTLPGSVYSSDDPNTQKRGMAVLVYKPMFQVFTICNTIAMYSSTAVSIVLMGVAIDSFHSARSALSIALRLLGVALVTTCVAFMAAVRLVVSEVSWLANVITIIGSIFLLIIVFSHTILTFRLRFHQPILRDVSDILLRIKIWYARTSTRVITKEQGNSNSEHVDKGKQEKQS